MRPTLALLPAITNDGDCWRFMDLPGAYVYVLPGHGERPRKAMTIEEMADEVVQRTSGPLDLLGVAFGGMLALHVLLRHPDRVRSAVLACTSPSVVGMSDAFLKRALDAERVGIGPGTVAASLERWFTPAALAEAGPEVEYARKTLRAIDPRAYADLYRCMARHDVDAELRSISQPVTLVAASQDAALGVAGMERLHERLPQSRLLYVDGPHMLHLERPEVLRAALAGHFRWLGGEAET